MNSPTGSSTDRLLAVAAAARLSGAVIDAWNAPPTDPAPGEIWRARWDARHHLVVVLSVSGQVAHAAPVSLEPSYADETAELLGAHETTLELPVALWRELTRSLPVRVLDRRIGHLIEPGGDRPAVRPHGDPVVTALDPRTEYRAMLEDTMDVFVAARWASLGTGNLRSMLADAGIETSDLVEMLQLTQQQAFGVLRGTAPLTVDQAAVVAGRTGYTVDQLLGANPPLPDELVARLDRPVVRAGVAELARRRHLTEQAAWQMTGYGVLALAARQTGTDKSIDWDTRIERYLSLHLG